MLLTGGTAFNGVVQELMTLTSRVTHVIPVSDDGGSTAEIVRVLGGPAVGDLRSRCLRLSDESTAEARAVKELLAHRLHATDSKLAKEEWYAIQEGDHDLWDGISEPYADIIRSFLIYFHTQIVASKNPIKFDFVNGSVGNFFFAGARMFFKSMEAAILLYSRVSRIPTESLVVPNIVLDDNVRVALGAKPEDGNTIRGQNEMSHPGADPKRFEKVKVNTKTGGIVRELVTKGGDIRRQGKALAASSDFRLASDFFCSWASSSCAFKSLTISSASSISSILSVISCRISSSTISRRSLSSLTVALDSVSACSASTRATVMLALACMSSTADAFSANSDSFTRASSASTFAVSSSVRAASRVTDASGTASSQAPSRSSTVTT